MSPFFSIIIPVFNSDKTLQETIDHILLQSFKGFELILIDGQSTDGTLEIIKSVIQTFPTLDINYISEPDGGIYDAMNKGIRMAKGSWFYFSGADDVFQSADVLMNIYREIGKEPVDLIYGNVRGTESGTDYIYDSVAKVLTQGIHHQSIFYKCNLFKLVGNYSRAFTIAADYHLTLKIFADKNLKTRYVNQDIALFGEAGLSSKKFDYKFYSYHYKLLSEKQVLHQVDHPLPCLLSSIYCCLYLAKEKINMGYAWRNLWFYSTRNTIIPLKSRFKNVLLMLYWSILPKPGTLSLFRHSTPADMASLNR